MFEKGGKKRKVYIPDTVVKFIKEWLEVRETKMIGYKTSNALFITKRRTRMTHTAISNMIYLNSDVTILGLMKNAYVVGIYSVSAKVYSIVKTVISAVLIVTVPRLAMLFGEKRIKEYLLHIIKMYFFWTICYFYMFTTWESRAS